MTSLQLLIEALSQLEQGQAQLLQIVNDKRKAIVEQNYDAIVYATSCESKMLRKIEEQENMLMENAQLFLQEKGIKSKLKLTVTELMRLVFDPEDKKVIHELQKQLTEHVLEVKRINELNQKLVEQSLSFIDFNLNLLVGDIDDDVTYSPPQHQEKRSSSRKLFDARG